jgi:hypothetical protein
VFLRLLSSPPHCAICHCRSLCLCISRLCDMHLPTLPFPLSPSLSLSSAFYSAMFPGYGGNDGGPRRFGSLRPRDNSKRAIIDHNSSILRDVEVRLFPSLLSSPSPFDFPTLPLLQVYTGRY